MVVIEPENKQILPPHLPRISKVRNVFAVERFLSGLINI